MLLFTTYPTVVTEFTPVLVAPDAPEQTPDAPERTPVLPKTVAPEQAQSQMNPYRPSSSAHLTQHFLFEPAPADSKRIQQDHSYGAAFSKTISRQTLPAPRLAAPAPTPAPAPEQDASAGLG